MRILCVTPSYWPAFQFGGPIHSLHAINKALILKGVKVTVYTTNIGIEKEVPENQEVEINGIKVTYFPYSKSLEFIAATGWQFSYSLLNSLKYQLTDFDLVYILAVWNFPVSAAAHYCRKYKIPYIISPRGTIYPETIAKKAWKKMIYYYLISKRDIKHASAIHYTTNDEAEKCRTSLSLENKEIIIPNGIALSEYKDIPSKEALTKRYPHLKGKKILLFLGRINWKKGLDILIKAFGKLANERDDVHLVIAGNDENNYINLVKNWIVQQNMNYFDFSSGNMITDEVAQVTFTGLLHDKEKLMAYAGSDIFVLPSYSENFGMSVVEAMAAGTPVLISNQVAIYREIEENNAGFIVKTTSEDIYKGLLELINSHSFRNRLSINGKKMARDYYNIENIAEKMIIAFKQVIKNV